jgi:hypothetical protein
MSKLLMLILCTLILLSGCQQKQKIFSHTYQKGISYDDILSIKLINSNQIIQQAFENSNFKLSDKSKFTIKVQYSKYQKICNNPLATAEDKSYIGFIKFTLLKNSKKVYMCQIDFKKDIDINMVNRFIDFMISELK